MTSGRTEDVSYWIDPDGVVHEVGHGIQPTHHAWMRRHVGVCAERAEELGWHRIVVTASGGELFTYGRVTLTARQQEEVNRLAVHHGIPNVREWIRGQ